MTEYSDDFERLWKFFGTTEKTGFGKRGSKFKAFKEFQKLPKSKSSSEWLFLIGKAAAEQANEKLQLKQNREFFESFPHVERYIKNRRWEDELEVGEPSLPMAELTLAEKRQNLINKMTDRSWAPGYGKQIN